MSTADTTSGLGCAPTSPSSALLVAVNALVGGMLGQERTVLPLLAEDEFGLTGYTFVLTYVFAFGVTKAATNYFAGAWSDRFGRKPVLLAGWLIAVPVPLMLIWAPTWGWVIAANVLLGINQGLTWSTTVIMKIDLVGPAGAGWRWDSTRPPATARSRPPRCHRVSGRRSTGCGRHRSCSACPTRSSASGCARSSSAKPATTLASKPPTTAGPTADTVTLTQPGGLHPHQLREPALSSASQAGMVNNLNDGLAWGLFPILFATAGLSIDRIGILAAVYPAVWGVGQMVTGAAVGPLGPQAPHHRRHARPGRRAGPGRRRRHLRLWAVAAVLLGAGTAMVYPTLLAAIGDVAHPAGAPARSASTASGVTAASPSAPSSPVSSPTCGGYAPPSGPPPPSPPPPGSSSPSACTRPTQSPTGPRVSASGRGDRQRGRRCRSVCRALGAGGMLSQPSVEPRSSHGYSCGAVGSLVDVGAAVLARAAPKRGHGGERNGRMLMGCRWEKKTGQGFSA